VGDTDLTAGFLMLRIVRHGRSLRGAVAAAVVIGRQKKLGMSLLRWNAVISGVLAMLTPHQLPR
jgi:hypothetical protein